MIRLVVILALLALPALTTGAPPPRLLDYAGASLNQEMGVVPRYTIPENATLIGGVTQTALVGRVPVKGQLRDPFQFKVLSGPRGLAANGFSLPAVIKGTVWRGTARGDWSGRCVSGSLESVTFIFTDGTIVTQRGKENEPLGHITDAWGNPCIPGEVSSDAIQWLGWRTLTAAFEGAAGAFAENQTTTTDFGDGGSRRVIDDPTAYALGNAASSSAADTNEWVRDRQAQSNDAIYLPAGAGVTIHLDQPIHLDYDPNGRKLVHDVPIRARTRYLD